MEQQLDLFIEYLYVIEENEIMLTKPQIDKLQMIQNKVSEIVKKVENLSSCTDQRSHENSAIHIHSQVPELQLAENRVHSFADYTELNEKIVKSGNQWKVMNKKGTKTLGTHDTREKAVKQLQAIEISKAQHAR
jgi:hypothetical protein